MANHYYSVAAAGYSLRRQRSDITVGTSSTSANPIELRITDAALSARDVYQFCEYLADLFATRDKQVIPGGTVT